jgi:hypothetical protein
MNHRHEQCCGGYFYLKVPGDDGSVARGVWSKFREKLQKKITGTEKGF